jgi:ribonuclease D
MPLVPKGPAPLLTTTDELAGLIDHLRASGGFAYDSEFIGELTYHPKLCVIQVASAERVALIDPLVGLDLTPFWELLADPSVEKIVHAGDQDIEPVVRHLNRSPVNFFDTQIAAGFCGLPYPVSLSKLVGELTGARLGKGLTFTHWDQRPLSPMQLRYAADDVRYLPAVRAELGRRLDANGHAGWAREECEALCDASQYRFDPETQYLRVKGAGSLQPRNLAVLRELTTWRDAAARQHDLPPRAFLKDEILIDLSRNPAKSVDKLERVRGLPRPIEHAHGAEIVEATQRGWSTPAANLPPQRNTEQTPSERFRSDALWAAAQVICAGNQVDSAVVTSRQEMADFYHAIAGGADLSDVRLMKGWRREALGEPLMRLVNGSTRLGLGWTDGSLRLES